MAAGTRLRRPPGCWRCWATTGPASGCVRTDSCLLDDQEQCKTKVVEIGALLKPQAWPPPPLQVRELQALLARREALAQDLRREPNRQGKASATATPQRVLKSIDDAVAFLERIGPPNGTFTTTSIVIPA